MSQQQAEKAIKNAWIAGIISTVMTLLMTLLLGLGWIGFIDVFIAGGLTFGIYKKSRAAAVAMLLYFVISQIVLRLEIGFSSSMFLAFVFAYYYAQGVRGTFAYHKFRSFWQSDNTRESFV